MATHLSVLLIDDPLVLSGLVDDPLGGHGKIQLAILGLGTRVGRRTKPRKGFPRLLLLLHSFFQFLKIRMEMKS